MRDSSRSSGLAVKALDSQDRGPEFTLPKLIKSLPEISGDLVVKSKLSLLSGSVALRQLNPVYKKGP